MFCTNCGRENSETAIYCQQCGKPLEAEEETRIARPIKIEAERRTEPDEERHIFSISPTLLFVKIGYAAAIVAALLLVALISMFNNLGFFTVSPWFSVFAGFLLLLIPAYFHLKQKLIRYTLTDAKIEIDSGLISRTTRNVPLRTIQDVTVSAGVSQRLLGFGDLIIDNASEQGGKIILKNINAPKQYADVLLKQMRLIGK